ncbi:unnamed protein product [Cochlearia groenlandica]
MFSLTSFPSLASIFSVYASITGYIMMIKPVFEMMLPPPLQSYIITYLMSYFESNLSTLTLIVENNHITNDGVCNELYAAAQVYLSNKISRDAAKLKISRHHSEKKVKLYLSNGEAVTDVYKGVKLTWLFSVTNEKTENVHECFELSFDKKHRDFVLNIYVPYVEKKAKMINKEMRILKMHSYCLKSLTWQSVSLEHPSTFKTIAMNNELKRCVMRDLDRFLKRKDFYKRVGKAWKRSYLLYGPSGTGKTSLVAAMANYLKFDIYDLHLASVKGDMELKRSLLGTKNNSILVVEDIDHSHDNSTKESTTLTLSRVLNCIDGLWSSCEEERIVIFTTNNKESLDLTLARPGRIDMHIHMGHCCFDGFKTLASSYLGLSENDQHHLYPEIKRLIEGQVLLTPSQVAEELMKNEDADVALEGLVRVLKNKKEGGEDKT